MARYEQPPDPRETSLNQQRKRRQRRDTAEPIPWLWLGLGVIVTIAAIIFSLSLANTFLARPPLSVSVGATPTIIYLTAPPSPVPSPTRILPTPTPIPTLTPIPTPNRATPPPQVQVDFFAEVANTDGIGVVVRGGPNVSNIQITLADEGTVILVIGGPETGGDFEWWQVRLADSTEGWVAAQFLEPASAPNDAASNYLPPTPANP